MKVTVLIPSYNHSKYIAQAINSVLDQTWKDIDLIVVDDSSTDDSVLIINSILNERGGFQFIANKKNSGLISSLNAGLRLAEGEYFCQLASDDFLPQDSLKKRAEYLTKNPGYVAVYTDGISFKGSQVEEGTPLYGTKRRSLFQKDDPIPMMLEGISPVFATGMFRTEVLRNLGGFDPVYRCYEDLEMPLLLCRSGKIGFLDDKVFCRREHETNTSSTTSSIRTDKILFYNKIIRNPLFSKYKSKINKQLRRSYLALGRHLTRYDGGSVYERDLFKKAWFYVLQDLRLLYHLIKWGR
jgi:alpha-1,3-rhamnosyltransferase